MGGGIGQWLLFRSATRDLCLFALVVPPDAATPVHDHLSWGLLGLYSGEQEETVFARRDEEAPVGEREALSVKLRRIVRLGDFYTLLPPPATFTASARPPPRPPSPYTCSPTTPAASGATPTTLIPEQSPPFRSGYVNRPCGAGDLSGPVSPAR